MNDLDRIYRELGDNICLFPFFTAFYQTNNQVAPGEMRVNSVRPCSMIINADPTHWDVVNNCITESRNTEAWRHVRRTFVEGSCADLPDCGACHYNEQSGATSARVMNNQFFSAFLNCDIVEEVKKIIANDYRTDVIRALDYYPSNYCNYECIMCDGGASSKRHTYEIKVLKRQVDLVLNAPDADFYEILNNIDVINFTGGETVLQKQVTELMDYLIAQDLAKNIVITLITNASSFPESLFDKFKKFKDVIFTISIDGVGAVIEYQRRGAKWADVEQNSVAVYRNFGAVVNYVLTCVNVFSFTDFLSWLHKNKLDKVCISPVFRHDCLSAAAIPDELKLPLLQKLRAARNNYTDSGYLDLLEQVISVVEKSVHDPKLLTDFVKHIMLEDTASKHKLVDVVPEWKSYFDKT